MTLPSGISLRPAVLADFPFLLQLRETTMKPIVVNHYAWDAAAQRARVEYHYDCAQIIQSYGKDVGLFKVVESDQDIHLSQIQLAPELQGQGVGSCLVVGLLERSVQSGRTVSLNVFRSNPALKLYTRLGFKPVDEDAHAFDMLWTPPQASQRTSASS